MNTYLGRIERKAHREGKQEGWREGCMNALKILLRSRFGNLPESIEAVLLRITEPDQLDALIQRAAIVSSLDEFRASIES